MIINMAIDQASKLLEKNDIASHLLDSEILMSKVINKDREHLMLNLNKKLDSHDYDYYKKLVYSRSKGKPIAYLIGKKAFWKDEFEINDKVLIPRPDTELIIEQVLRIYNNKSQINLLEIGFGSGCIILSILKEKKYFLGKGIDLSKECIEICNINAKKLKVSNRLKLFKSDVDNFYLGKYDLIISNPPYIKKLDLRYLDKDVINFEPIIALDGGLEGLSEIRKVIDKSSELIKKKGKLILEIAFDQKKKVREMLINKGFYVDRVVKDLASNDRCIISTKI
ncbi:peptide chain release factor N(5)-glutamine methyltransferase [Pelagibacterales bacterium SAG-MED13]|nr:peptide chain release factor N(5)-glutamine methyltransferase [Pelagibacterales bacterium SAG-MED13]